MKNCKIIFLILSFVFFLQDAKAVDPAHPSLPSPQDTIKGILKNLVIDNQKFVEKQEAEHFEEFMHKQNPRATVVSCSDSRAQTNAFDEAPENDLFMIRNIGNQFALAKGSVAYGVEVLKTPLLIFIGHTGCGAVKAVLEKEEKIPQVIKKDLKYIKISRKLDLNHNVIVNVNAQIQEAIHKYHKEIKEKKLVIMGAVYDLHNNFKKGHGRLVFLNVNGETSVQNLKEHSLFTGLNDIKFLPEHFTVKP